MRRRLTLARRHQTLSLSESEKINRPKIAKDAISIDDVSGENSLMAKLKKRIK